MIKTNEKKEIAATISQKTPIKFFKIKQFKIMKNYRFTLKKDFYCLTKTSKVMQITLSVIFALILQSVTSSVYSQNIEIYSDDFGAGIDNDTQADGDLDYYSTDEPNNGSYCIQWSAAAEYEAITFNFNPDVDLASMVDDGYALDIYVRGAASTDASYSFNLRFLDSKTGTDDHPWRKIYTIDNSMMSYDGQWHHLHILLSDFAEQGSWDGSWYNPAGLFDWSAIDKFEIVGEAQAMVDNDEISFDNIYIKKETSTDIQNMQSGFVNISYGSNQSILLKNESEKEVTLNLIDLSGHTVLQDQFTDQYIINGSEFKKGIYILQMYNDVNQKYNEKIYIR